MTKKKRYDDVQALNSPEPKKLKRPDRVAKTIREKIIQSRLDPGDRIPAQWLDPEQLGVARGTIREAMKILEFQGLTRTKTGPGGGVFVTEVLPGDAIQMLDNLFLFKAPSISDIYGIRKKLEPELAASVAGRLSEPAMEALQLTIRLYEDEPTTAEEEYQQRLAELDFHAELANNCENPILSFICRFLVSLLRDMTVCREIYRKPNPQLRESGFHYQVQLLRAIKSGDSDRARLIMSDHMIEAERYMLVSASIRLPGTSH